MMFFEHKALYQQKFEVPDDPEFMIPFGKADIKRTGSDVTIVANLLYVRRRLRRQRNSRRGYFVRSWIHEPLVPLDMDTIIQSVTKTGRLVVVHEAHRSCGWGAEIAAGSPKEPSGIWTRRPFVLGLKRCAPSMAA